ncbi:MAG TPA: nitric-oxide reductase large subunit [Candidatus Acidoferrales bacterium]
MRLTNPWRYGLLFMLILCYTVLIVGGLLWFRVKPPIPISVVDPKGNVFLTGQQILDGQSVFQKYGLMDHGSVFGEGAYLAPDFTADYLHRECEIVRDAKAMRTFLKSYAQLTDQQRAVVNQAVRAELKTNRYDAATGKLVLPEDEVAAFQALVRHYSDLFRNGDDRLTLRRDTITQESEVYNLTAFFAWTAWAAVTPRPGASYSYTNNWPYEPAVGNEPTHGAVLWSALSLIGLIGGLAAMLFFMGRYRSLGWQPSPPEVPINVPDPGTFPISAANRAIGKFFLVVAWLLVAQVAMGTLSVHYFVEGSKFYGISTVNFLPFNVSRSFHVQLSILWIAIAWLLSGLFVVNQLAEREPPRQWLYVNVLFALIVGVTVGSLSGIWLGVRDSLGKWWFWLGHQGWEYFELGRLWQIAFVAAMVFWAWLFIRPLWPRLKAERKPSKGAAGLSYLLLYCAIAIPLFYVFALFYTPGTHWNVADYWRFWVIHLWVEGFFELFATAIIAFIFTQIGLVTEDSAVRLVYLDAFLYLGTGIIGTGHHWYWIGAPEFWMALGAVFSAMQVIPLTILTLVATNFQRIGQRQKMPLVHKWPIYFLAAAGFWNFLGAGVFGFLVNLPIVSYFQHGTYWTPLHAHAALMGAYGMMAIGLMLFPLRYLIHPDYFDGRLLWVAFWGMNVGLLLMCVPSLFTTGLLQVIASMREGYWYARSIEFIQSRPMQLSIWARLPGDTLFAIGALALALFVTKGIFHLRRANRGTTPGPEAPSLGRQR